MTPEEHIARAEKYLADQPGTYSQGELNAARAAVHVRIAEFKKKYSPDGGRPIRSSGRMHSHVNTHFCGPNCPAFGTDSTNYPRPIPDNPQA